MSKSTTVRMEMKWLGAGLACVAMTIGIAEAAKPNAEDSLKLLQNGNDRFVAGKSTHPDGGVDRRELAAKSDQGNYAVATIVSCSDSRVPVEFVFDTGIMDVFVVRIAGNVCDTDEIGSAEYGLCHVKTPLLVVLGHSQCGAVTAVAKSLKGEGHALEKNIPPLVDNIIPAVEKVSKAFPQAAMENLITRSIEENVWQGIESVFVRSAAIRELAKSGAVKVVGAIYELETGKVRWLSADKTAEILKKAEADPARETQAMAAGGHEEHGKEGKTNEVKAEPKAKEESKPAEAEHGSH